MYTEGQTFYSFQSNLSATRVRKICDEIEKFAKQDVIKVGNPAKVLFDTEEDLMVCLGIQEPDVTATIIPEEQAKPVMVQPEP